MAIKKIHLWFRDDLEQNIKIDGDIPNEYAEHLALAFVKVRSGYKETIDQAEVLDGDGNRLACLAKGPHAKRLLEQAGVE